MKHLYIVLVILAVVISFQPAAEADGSSDDLAYHPLISEMQGDVRIKGRRDSVWEPAEKGSLLLSGDTVKTGPGASARIQFLSGTVQLYENAVIVIPSTGIQDRKKDIKEIIVEKGSAFFGINPTGVRRQFEFRTRNVQGGVRGTRFTVSYLDGGTSVVVYSGKVVVSDLTTSGEGSKELTGGRAVRVDDQVGFDTIRAVNTDFDVDDYGYTVPPGLDSRGLPADYHADPSNLGVRDRGAGHGRESAPGQNK